MNRDEKMKLMKMKIISSAITEFSNNHYENASMNHICQIGNISKGIIYHYYKDKDELYLECLKVCFETLVDYYQQRIDEIKTFQDYFELRMKFFHKHPELKGLFFHTLLFSPSHLYQKIEEIKLSYYDLNHRCFRELLKSITLRNHITVEKAIEYLDIMQNTFNNLFRNQLDYKQIDDLIDEHEAMVLGWIDLMLYGIAQKRQ